MQIGKRILYFLPLKKARASPNGIFQVGIKEFLLQGPGLVATAVQDGNLIGPGPARKEGFYLGNNPFRFLFLAFAVEVDYGPAFRLPSEEVFGNAVFVVGYHAVGNVKDARGGAVVFVQDYCFVGGKLYKKVWACAPPLVNGLVRVSHHKEVAVLGAEALHKVPVVKVAVLGFVHHYVIEGVLPVLAGIREVVQDVLCDIHEVVEVQRIVLHLAAHVAAEAGGAAHFVGDL